MSRTKSCTATPCSMEPRRRETRISCSSQRRACRRTTLETPAGRSDCDARELRGAAGVRPDEADGARESGSALPVLARESGVRAQGSVLTAVPEAATARGAMASMTAAGMMMLAGKAAKM
eukprot:1088942-Prymnesium_polylepis.2